MQPIFAISFKEFIFYNFKEFIFQIHPHCVREASTMEGVGGLWLLCPSFQLYIFVSFLWTAFFNLSIKICDYRI